MIDVGDDGDVEDGLNGDCGRVAHCFGCPVCALRDGISGKVRVLTSLA
jgi:hypothetical protein